LRGGFFLTGGAVEGLTGEAVEEIVLEEGELIEEEIIEEEDEDEDELLEEQVEGNMISVKKMY
jgi:hypothetical protein